MTLFVYKSKFTVRQNLTFLLYFFSLYSFSQLYVQEGTTLSLGSPQAILSSQESINQIDSHILGEGTLYLNRTQDQKFRSTHTLLELPNLHIENAHFVQIETALHIHNQMFVDQGELILSHDLVLRNPSALVLGVDASLSFSAKGQLVYTTQFQESHPLAIQSIPLLKYTGPNTSQERPQAALITTATTSNFGSLANLGYTVYFTHSTPPPKV